MRLLFRDADDEYKLAEFNENDVPPYAILSHTWLAEEEEPSFQDLIHRTGKEKHGYRKLLFCGEQGRRDGLHYFWVDTCCIDKSNTAELNRSINSMFRWYRKAARCYVHLWDVSVNKRKASERSAICTWQSSFQSSRWFQRGWTLQELLAPASLEFFSREGTRLGDKQSLEQSVCNITGVPEEALHGAHLSHFSDNDRFSWGQRRQTTIEEDKAYSLLGIFGVEMRLSYGEGAAIAFQRLENEIEKLNKCLRDLRLTDPGADKRHIEDRKGGLLSESYRWILNNPQFQCWANNKESRLLWIKGDPGKGKTMLLCGVINELEKSTTPQPLLSYFFCQAGDSNFNDATAVLRGLMYMLLRQQPSLFSYIRKKYDQAGKGLFEDTNTWNTLVEILGDLVQDLSLTRIYFIIDALDECVVGRPKLLDFIIQMSCSSGIKWLVSSRNWHDIEDRFRNAGQNLSLELNEKSVSAAVRSFVHYKINRLTERKTYDEHTRDAVLHRLLSSANDTFLWVALVCQELEHIPKRKALAKLTDFPPGLDKLYEGMMKQIRSFDDDDSTLCKQILAVVGQAYRPLKLKELASLAGTLQDVADDPAALQEFVGLCGSLLTVREDTVYFVHQSAKDYLLTHAMDEIYPSGQEEVHYSIFSKSLQVMSKTLQYDIYKLQAPGYPVHLIKLPDPDPLAAVRYSCLHWIDHFCVSKVYSGANLEPFQIPSTNIELFFKERYLYWLEALGICNAVPNGVRSMTKLEALFEGQEFSAVAELIHDASRFIMHFMRAIEHSPLQVYASGHVFTPNRSLLKAQFQEKELPDCITVKPAIGNHWNACLQTLEGHSRLVNSVVLSRDGTRLASGSDDKTIKIWDTSSGNCLRTLEGHGGFVTSVAFSEDGTWLASGSHDKTIRIWDTISGNCLRTLEGHGGFVTSVAFSEDGRWLASGSHDKTIRIWDTISGNCLRTLVGHGGFVTSVAFSENGTWLASGSHDKTIRIWDTISGNCLRTLVGHGGFVTSVAFSEDGTWLASGSHDKTIRIWDTSSGNCPRTLEGHGGFVTSVAFSEDGTWLASGSHDKTIKIWDADSATCLQTLRGHGNVVHSVIICRDGARLASGSRDWMVKIWDTTSSGTCLQPLEGHNGVVVSVVFSRDGSRLATGSYDTTIKIWDASSGACLQTLGGHGARVNSVVFSHDGSRLASGSNDRTIKIWDASSGDCLQTLKGHGGSVYSVVFSRDGSRLASGSVDRTIKIWDAISGAYMCTLKGNGVMVLSVVFSHDGTRLASGSDTTIKIWDVGSETCLPTLRGHRDMVCSVVFSHDGTLLASGSHDTTVKIWDTSSATCLQTLDIGKELHNIAFDHTCSHLLSEIGALVLRTTLSSSHASSSSSPNLISVSVPYIPRIQGWGISVNAEWITYNSENRLWVPPEYRPTVSAVSGNSIGAGNRTGMIWICAFQAEET